MDDGKEGVVHKSIIFVNNTTLGQKSQKEPFKFEYCVCNLQHIDFLLYNKL